MSGEPLLDRATLRRAWTLLSERLAARGLTCNVYLFGGAAMLEAFGEREVTRDVDARFTSTGPVLVEVAAVGQALGLPSYWLNEQGTVYLPRTDDPEPGAIFDSPNLQVLRSSDRHLLAMKAVALRPGRDVEDVKLLMRRLGVESVQQVVDLVAEVLPDEELTPRKLAGLEAALAGL